MKKIRSSDLWEYPFGTCINFNDEQKELNSIEGTFYYISKKEYGSILYNDFGQEHCIDEDYEISIRVPELEELVENYLNGLVYSVVSLTEEPAMHKEEIEFETFIVKQMVELLKAIRSEKE